MPKTTLKTKSKRGRKPAASLTEREEQILLLLCDEKSNVEIGAELGLSTRTVEGFRAKLLTKTGAKNLAGLVKYAHLKKLYRISKENTPFLKK